MIISSVCWRAYALQASILQEHHLATAVSRVCPCSARVSVADSSLFTHSQCQIRNLRGPGYISASAPCIYNTRSLKIPSPLLLNHSKPCPGALHLVYHHHDGLFGEAKPVSSLREAFGGLDLNMLLGYKAAVQIPSGSPWSTTGRRLSLYLLFILPLLGPRSCRFYFRSVYALDSPNVSLSSRCS